MMRALLMGLVKAYQLFLSPWLGSARRFEPTCSFYALGALQQHGAALGADPLGQPADEEQEEHQDPGEDEVDRRARAGRCP